MSEPSNTSGATRYPTNDELDYERRKAAGFPSVVQPINQSKGVVSQLQTQYAVEGNDTSAYIGVTDDRMTYANETEKPLAADEGVEYDLEHRLLDQPTLVAPTVPTPKVEQTDGGGSSQETLYTATSGTNFSAEIAEPTTTETVETPTGEVEQGVSGGSTGETVSEAEQENVVVAPDAGPSSVQVEQTEEESAPSPTPPTPARRSKATGTTTNDS